MRRVFTKGGGATVDGGGGDGQSVGAKRMVSKASMSIWVRKEPDGVVTSQPIEDAVVGGGSMGRDDEAEGSGRDEEQQGRQ